MPHPEEPARDEPHLEEALRWLELADRDIAAFALLARTPEIHFTIAGFHAQQAVEKSLKAVLFRNAIEFPRLHDLAALANILIDHGIDPPCTPDELRILNPFAVAFRYEDVDLDLLTREEAAHIVDRIRRWAGDRISHSSDA